ncbi:hypothetical protein SpCBS45565_g04126 [Spizellomyces sp. 'palustris']|nr:hypothetical protein SpCBS45565_g04126 [Spizellomyces sp. 'palustris']
MVAPSQVILRFAGHADLRTRLVLSILTNTPVYISAIHCSEDDSVPGLTDFELDFVALLCLLTCSTHNVLHDGTALKFIPGPPTLNDIQHSCCPTRSVGYFLEPLLLLSVFCEIHLELLGITNDKTALSVDTLLGVHVPVLREFGVEPPVLTVHLRGAPPDGLGRVSLHSVPSLRPLRAPILTILALITHIRGTCYTSHIPPSLATDPITSATALLKRTIPDVHITHCPLPTSSTPGYALTLTAHAEPHTILSASCAFLPRPGQTDVTHPLPETLGVRTARLLLQEMKKGGCVDKTAQGFVLVLLALAEGKGQVRVGGIEPLT